jgi:two-component system, OmpR family, response regulator
MIERVLAVEDDPAIRKVIELSLTRVGNWQTMIVESGSKAIVAFSEFKPDVILLDVMMPGMNGIDTFKKLREQFGAHIPIIFLTAKVQKQEIQAYAELGAAGVVLKPFDPGQLPAQIKRILAGPPASVCA